MDIQYSVKRSSKRKKLSIVVERDRSIVVHAPASVTQEKIEEVVASKRQWLYEKCGHPQKYRASRPPGKELVSGEATLYLGRNYRIEVDPTSRGGIRFSNGFTVPKLSHGKCVELLQAWYQGRAAEKVLPRVKMHARELGVEYRSAKIVDGRYRWGSCTPQSNININWKLIKAPMFVIDYVIIHELAHLIEPNHNDRFWNIVRTQCPVSEKARSWLREHGQLLEDLI